MQRRILLVLNFLLVIFGCNSPYTSSESTEAKLVDTTESTMIDSASIIKKDKIENELKLEHKYFMVDKDAEVSALLELENNGTYTQVVLQANGFKLSGSGEWMRSGNKIRFNRTHGISLNEETELRVNEDGKFWIILSNGRVYVQDDDGYYIRNSVATPRMSGGNVESEKPDESEESYRKSRSENGNLVYEGRVSDEESGFEGQFRLVVKSDLSAASINGGPFIKLEDQGDGSYIWTDGTIVGMSIRPGRNSCIVYGSEGDYFGTFYRQ